MDASGLLVEFCDDFVDKMLIRIPDEAVCLWADDSVEEEEFITEELPAVVICRVEVTVGLVSPISFLSVLVLVWLVSWLGRIISFSTSVPCVVFRVTFVPEISVDITAETYRADMNSREYLRQSISSSKDVVASACVLKVLTQRSVYVQYV